MTHNLYVLNDRVAVKRLAGTNQTQTGLFIPDNAKEKPQEGTVVAVGKGKLSSQGNLIPLEVKVGDRVLFGKYSGAEIKVDDGEILVMREEEILGILISDTVKE